MMRFNPAQDMERVDRTDDRFHREWLAQGHILCYRLCDNARTTVDVWAGDIAHMMDTWSVGRPWLLLIDMRHERAVASAYSLHHLRRLGQIHPELAGRVAILTAHPFMANVVTAAARAVPNRYRERVVFACESEAVAWLLQDDTITSS